MKVPQEAIDELGVIFARAAVDRMLREQANPERWSFIVKSRRTKNKRQFAVLSFAREAVA